MTFSEPIVAGETILQDIQSEGFTSGASGWRIERDGDSEFNGVIVRGRIDVTGDDPDESISIYEDATQNPVMDFTAANGDLYRFQADNSDLTIGPVSDPNSRLFFVDGEGIALRSAATGAPSTLFDDDTGFLKYGVYSPWTEETWHALAGAGLWAADAASPPQYRLMPDGTVRLRGWFTGGATAAGTVVATLPAGYRPGTRGYFICAKPNQDVIQSTIEVNTAGQIIIRQISNQGAAATAHFSLDNISFVVAGVV